MAFAEFSTPPAPNEFAPLSHNRGSEKVRREKKKKPCCRRQHPHHFLCVGVIEPWQSELTSHLLPHTHFLGSCASIFHSVHQEIMLFFFYKTELCETLLFTEAVTVE